MRIVSWNCAQKLDAKYEALLALKPDIAIIPECAEPDILMKKASGFRYSDCEWQGDIKDKGLGVSAFNGHSLRRHQSWDRDFHIFLPIEVRGPTTMNLLALWAFNHRAPKKAVINPVTTGKAIDYYSSFLRAHPAVVAGDFNANVIWDKGSKDHKFSPVDAALRKLGLQSAYHAATGDPLGEEEKETIWFQRNVKKTYHIDYVYVDRKVTGLKVLVGDVADWLKLSDHAPVIVDI